MSDPAAARRTRTLAAAGAVLALGALAALVVGPRLDALVRTDTGVPLWDEAAQGFTGLELADAMRGLHPIEILRIVNQQVVWPFVHGLLLAPWFLLLGQGFDTPAHMSVAMFGVTALLVFAAGLPLDATRGAWIGAIAASLLLVSPLYRVFATLGMLEMSGACLLSLTVALHARVVTPAAGRGTLIAAGASTAALFLLKYNYGLLWLAPLAAHEWWVAPRERRAAVRERALAWLRAGGWRRPLPLLVVIWGTVLAAIAVTGGFAFEIAGRRVSLRSPGNGAYVLLLVLVTWLVVSVARAPGAWRARWYALAERRRVMLATVVAPLLVWFLIPYPNRVKALASFVVNRTSGPAPWSLDGLLYYPRAFVMDYSPTGALGWAVLAFALIPPRRGATAARLAYVALVVGLGATMAHRYHDPRFLFTTALLVWLNAARAVVDLVERALARLPGPAAEAVWVAGLAATIAAATYDGPRIARVAETRRAYRAPGAVLAAIDAVLDRAAREDRPVTLLGYSYVLSPGLLSWRAKDTHPALKRDDLPRRAPWLEAGASEARIAARIDGLLDRADLILAALPEPGSPAVTPGYRAEVWADSVSVARLAADPRVGLESESELPKAGFRVWAFRKRDARARPPVGEWL